MVGYSFVSDDDELTCLGEERKYLAHESIFIPSFGLISCEGLFFGSVRNKIIIQHSWVLPIYECSPLSSFGSV